MTEPETTVMSTRSKRGTTDNALTIAFRADASAVIGGGHVMRCLALADELQRRGHGIAFFCQAGTRETVPRLSAGALPVTTVAADPQTWIDAIESWQPGGVDVLVLDSYSVAADVERALRAVARWIVVIDDLANRPHDCDVLLDQNLGRNASDYAGLVPTHCRVLAGPQYALLRPEFASARPAALARRKEAEDTSARVGRILVSLGMTDVGGLTAPVVEAVLDAQTGAAIDVVIGSCAPSLAAIQALSRQHARLAVHINAQNMAHLMAQADLGLGAAGSTSWERCCLGLPTILLVLADNQRPGAAALLAAGAALTPDLVGGIGPETRHTLSRQISLAGDSEALARMSKAAAGVCDGQGVRRTVAPILGLDLIPATLQHAHAVWEWRNDPASRAVSHTGDAIAWPDHEAWFTRVLCDERRVMMIATLEGTPCAIVRFDRQEGESGPPRHLVSINLHPSYRGRGLGDLILGAACDALRATSRGTVMADIRVDNQASGTIFARCGFHKLTGPDATGFERYELRL